MRRFAACVALLHVVGWGLLWVYARRHPAFAGLGTLAYSLGLRHAFDADHIAAIDNVTRKLRQDDGRPEGVGFFFSLGHATVMLAMVVALAAATRAVDAGSVGLQSYGRYIGAGISGTFLWIIGLLNLLVVVQLLRLFLELRRGTLDSETLETRVLDRGLVGRFLLGRLCRRLRSSWQMYPVGLLFGLSFDTASELGLLALAAGAATHEITLLAVISLPLLFAAGMSVIDTAFSAFMGKAYDWAFSNPIRRAYCNLTLTGLSVAVALLVGTVELLQVAGFIRGVDLNRLGYGVVALFMLTWAAAAIVWRAARLEDRWRTVVD